MTNIELLLEKGDLESLSYLSMVYYEGIEVERNLSKCLKFATEAIEGGFSDAQFYLGRLYYEGIEVEQDYNQAFDLFEKSAKQNNTKAIYWLGRCYFLGKEQNKILYKDFYCFILHTRNSDAQIAIENCFNENNEEVYQKAIEIIIHRSNELKEAKFQNLLGLLYEHGNGLPKDHSIAFELYHLSRKQRDPFGIKNYGLCYYRNIGIEKNLPRAFKLFEKSALLGNHRALNSTGYCLQNGIGVEKDVDRSIKFFKKCLKLGNLVGINSLALAYQNGWGVEEDLAKCRELYLKAAYSKYRMSEFNIGFLLHYGVGYQVNVKQAVKWYEQSHKHGYLSATNSLGYCYQEGIGFKKNRKKAFQHYLIAAKGGNKYGECNVGLCYLYGCGKKRNSRLAYLYLKKAIDHGHLDAKNILENNSQVEFILYHGTDLENIELLVKDPNFEINQLTSDGNSILIHFDSTNSIKNDREEIPKMIEILINNGLDLQMKNFENKLTIDCISNDLSKSTKKYGALSIDFDRLFDNRINTDYSLGKGLNVHKIWVEKRTRKSCNEVKNVFQQFYDTKDGFKKCNDFLRWVYSGVINNKQGIIQICDKLEINFSNHTTIRQDLIDLWNDIKNSYDFKIIINLDNNNNNNNNNNNKNNGKSSNNKDTRILESIPVHKFFLIVVSGLYRNLFETVNSNLSQVTDFSSKSFETLSHLFEYLYTGTFLWTGDDDQELIKEELSDAIEYYQLNPHLSLNDFLN